MASLSSDQVQLQLNDAGQDKKIKIAERLGTQLDQASGEIDCKIAEEVARQLAQDAVEVVRAALSKGVRHSKFLPKDIAFMLAFDLESVAVPFLEVTQIFSTEELCQIAREAEHYAKAALARRAGVPREVAEILADCGNQETAGDLLDNATAELSEDAFLSVLNRFDETSGLFEKIVDRHILPPAIVVQLIPRISSAAAQKLSLKYKRLGDFLHPVEEEAKFDAILAMIGRTDPADMAFLAGGMAARNELCPQLIYFALKRNCGRFFLAALAALAELPLKKVEEAFFVGTIEQRQMIYKAARVSHGIVPLLESEFDRLRMAAAENGGNQALAG